MNISEYILEYLKEFGFAKIPDFGAFSFKNSQAVINPEDQSILPPAYEIAFESDYELQSDEFIQYLVSRKGISKETVLAELKIQTDYWKKKLQSEQMLEIPDLGSVFIEDHQVHFKGNRVEVDSPDFYGLEKIKYSEIKNRHPEISSTQKSKKEYQLSRAPIFWIVLILGIITLLWGAYTNQEALFGKKSFDINELMNRKEKKSEDFQPAEKFPFKALEEQKKQDSLKKDSLQQIQNIQTP